VSALAPSRLLPRDVISVGSVGLRTRRLRAALSAVGIAIGIASMVAVLGISASSKADLVATLDRLGTNLLTVKPGQTIFGESATLPVTAAPRLTRIAGVESVASITDAEESVRRTDYVPPGETNAITVLAADTSLLESVAGTVAEGSFLTPATGRYPTVVLGAIAARRLGIVGVASGTQLYVGGRWFTLVGKLSPVALAPELDRAAIVGYRVAKTLFGTKRSASTIYVRADPDRIGDIRSLLGPTANPEHPEETQVSRPSDVLAARAAAKSSFTALFLGLGAVALLVGGVGIANVMFVSVLERRSEIGLRRALGATRRHIWVQFLTESLLLAGIGGIVGAAMGAAISVAYSLNRGWASNVPAPALAGGVAAALLIGAGAGLYPAVRAARLAPTDALRTV
jgi:putative ABC transport system permease protein